MALFVMKMSGQEESKQGSDSGKLVEISCCVYRLLQELGEASRERVEMKVDAGFMSLCD